MKVVEHIEEVRARFIRSAVFMAIAFLIGTAVSASLIRRIISDLSPEGVTFISLSPLEFIYTQLMVGLFFSVFISSPFLMYQIIAFVRPAARKNEKAAMIYMTPAFLLLFLCGAYFGYAVFLSVVLPMLASLSSLASVANLWSIYRFMTFIFSICITMGIIFELPLALLVLKHMGIVNNRMLSEKRLHIYVGLFLLSAVITPPDAITQVLLAIPMIALYELSLLAVRF